MTRRCRATRLLLLTGIALTIGYVALLGTLGFFIDTVLYIAALTWTGRYRRWPVIVAVALRRRARVHVHFHEGRLPVAADRQRRRSRRVSLLLMQLLGIR